MQPFTELSSRTIVLPTENIDTDQIIPGRFLTTTERAGLGQFAFHDWRFDANGNAIADHPLNTTDTVTHQILVAGNNFGCGSSREHAPWALLDFGLRVVISTEMGDIFRSNSLKNGFLPIIVEPEVHQQLLEHPGQLVTVDLEQNQLSFGNHKVNFDVEPFSRRCMLEGKDSLGLLVAAEKDIAEFERNLK